MLPSSGKRFGRLLRCFSIRALRVYPGNIERRRRRGRVLLGEWSSLVCCPTSGCTRGDGDASECAGG